MKFHYAGKYSGNPDDIPCLDHEPGAVQFKIHSGICLRPDDKG